MGLLGAKIRSNILGDLYVIECTAIDPAALGAHFVKRGGTSQILTSVSAPHSSWKSMAEYQNY